MISKKDIDYGKAFDWGKASADYARYRDIYPQEFYDRIVGLGICTKGQKVLDIGTGTGVLPRNLYRYGAEFIGTDISENQIIQARILSEEKNMDIQYQVSASEELAFPDNTFDVVTACQCFFYFDHPVLMPKIAKILKHQGRLAVLYMSWLPEEDRIAGATEELVLKYNPVWTGAGEFRKSIFIPELYQEQFELESELVFDLNVPFTRESWNGRIKACRGTGASLSEDEFARFEADHIALLDRIAPERFEVLHYAAITVLKVRRDCV